RRVAARRPPDRRLVDVNDLVEVFHALDGIVSACRPASAMQQLSQPAVQHIEHQRALATARYTGDHHQLAKRDVHIHILEVVLARTPDAQQLAVAVAPLRRERDTPPPGEERASYRV